MVMKMVLKKNKSGYQTFKENGKIQSVHKRVLEKKLGRPVRDGYEAHHKDGDKNNNRSSNMQEKEMGKHRREHSRK